MQDNQDVTQLSALSFGAALSFLKNGQKVQRVGWNGKGMWVQLVTNKAFQDKDGTVYPGLPFLQMKTVTGDVVPWLASQTDILAEDWQIFESV